MGTFLEQVRTARREMGELRSEMQAYRTDVDAAAAAQVALVTFSPRVEPHRPAPPSPSPGVAGGGDHRKPFIREDSVAAPSAPSSLPQGALPFAAGPAAPAAAPSPGAAGLAPNYAKLGLPGKPGSLWTDPRTGRDYILGPYGFPNFGAGPLAITPYGTSSSGGGPSGRSAGGGGGDAGVLPPGFTRDVNGNAIPANIPPPTTTSGAKGDRYEPPLAPTPGDEEIARTVRGVERAVTRTAGTLSRDGAVLAARFDKLIAAVRDAGRFDLRSPL